MSTALIQQEEITLTVIDERAFSTSNQIAEHFGKRHDNVLRAIANLECSDEFRRLNFEGTDYIDKNGDLQPSFNITRDGFAFLAMGFTGKEAAAWKEKYIKAFNALEDDVKRLYAENQALLKAQLTNCHRAIETMKIDSSVARAKARAEALLPLEEAQAQLDILTKQNEALARQNEAAQMKIEKEAMRLEYAKHCASVADAQTLRNLERDVAMWKKGCAKLEERLSSLEYVCGITRDDKVPERVFH